jgi:Peptidase M15
MNRLTVNDVLTASGRYPARAKDPSLTAAVRANIERLVDAVNGLLDDLGWTGKIDCTSGFRPAAANASAGGAKQSAHMLGLAVDLLDNDEQVLALEIMRNPELLKKHGLWLEHPDHTRGDRTNWAHLDMKERRDRPVRVFKL